VKPGAPAGVAVGTFLEDQREALDLELLAGAAGLSRTIRRAEAASPGLVLAGFTDRFPQSRLQVLGETEIRYLERLPEDGLAGTVDRYLAFDLPCIIVTKGLRPPAYLLRRAEERGVPVVVTGLTTAEFYQRIKLWLDRRFAPSAWLHGSLADVYGVGLLFQGPSGIGKSECVLDLVERGHRLVADDQVHVTRRGKDVLIGRASEVLGFHMEIRGVGILDIQSLFGIRAVRLQKRIEVVVMLQSWEEAQAVERVGLDERRVEILGVPVPHVTVPINPGKNLTVIAEVVAMNHLQKFAGGNAAESFNEALIRRMRDKRSAAAAAGEPPPGDGAGGDGGAAEGVRPEDRRRVDRRVDDRARAEAYLEEDYE
jgi:HPr kinase/phosphorylase